MADSICKSDLILEKAFFGERLGESGYGCDSELSSASDECRHSDDSGHNDDCMKIDSHVESEQLPQDQPYDNDLISYYLQDVSRILPLSPMASMVFIVAH